MQLFRHAMALCMAAMCLGACALMQQDPGGRSLPRVLDDMGTQALFSARLLARDAETFARVDSTVSEGRVHITGTVPTQDDRQAITRIAWTLPAVTQVINDVEVANSPGLVDAARDRWISARLRANLMADPSIRDGNYQIDTANGTIYLNGVASDAAERDRVLRRARAIPEAVRVVDYIIMRDDPRRTATAPAPADRSISSTGGVP
jgi:osmotically-inducible protein OsmY